jgi:hypothetical protein
MCSVWDKMQLTRDKTLAPYSQSNRLRMTFRSHTYMQRLTKRGAYVLQLWPIYHWCQQGSRASVMRAPAMDLAQQSKVAWNLEQCFCNRATCCYSPLNALTMILTISNQNWFDQDVETLIGAWDPFWSNLNTTHRLLWSAGEIFLFC